MKKKFIIGLVMAVQLIVVCCAVSKPDAASKPEHSEYAVKAAFIYNFMRYVSWTQDALPEGEPLVVAISGDFNFYNEFNVLSEKKLGSHKIIVKRLSDFSKKDKYHLVFIVAGDESKLPGIMTSQKGKSVLIVSDSDVAMGKGAIISFYESGKNIRFKIDSVAAKRRGLKISSKLLRLATIVDSADDSNGGK